MENCEIIPRAEEELLNLKNFDKMSKSISHYDEEEELNLNQWRKPPIDFETLAVSGTIDPGTFSRNSMVMPIVTSSVFISHGSVTDPMNDGFHYGRCGNPSRDHFENCMALLDRASHALAFSSGVAGISAVVQTLKKGDHIIYQSQSNGDSDWLFRNKWTDFGMEVDFIYSNDSNTISEAIKSNTKFVWLETPINPTLVVVDISKIARAVHNVSKEILVVVDNTFLTPIFQQPLELGADVVVYSATKYLCGHADVTMGVVTTNNKELYKRIQENQICLGGIPSPFDCYLMIRSLKTLPIRMKQHFRSGQKVANFLSGHPCVERVNHPGLKSHPQHALAIKQQYGHSGMVTFLIKGDIKEAAAFMEALKVFVKAPSLGTDVSLASIPSKASHSWLPEEERQKMKITDNMIRLSVGLENADCLIKDLDQALRQAVPIWI